MRFLLYFYIGILLSACGSGAQKDVLPGNKMEAVLYDVIRADELVDFKKLSDSTYNAFSKRTALYDTIFQLHAINKDIFRKSLQYYQGRPDLLKEIFDNLQKKVTDTMLQKQPPRR